MSIPKEIKLCLKMNLFFNYGSIACYALRISKKKNNNIKKKNNLNKILKSVGFFF